VGTERLVQRQTSGVLTVSTSPDFAARWLGVYYPPAVLVLMLVAIISVASLSFSVILSRQQRQIDRLIEENAIMAAELRELRWEREATARGPAIRPMSEPSLSNPIAAVSASDIVVGATDSGVKARNH